MRKLFTVNRYIPQGQGPGKPFSKIWAGCRPLALVMLVGVIVAISTPVASAKTENCRNPGPALGRFAPAVPPRPVTDQPFFDEQGDPVRLTDYRGRGLVLNFWATWCVPCIRELPALARLKVNLADDGIDVIALSVDRGGVPVVRRFLKKVKIDNLDILIDVKSKVSRKTRVSALPTTVLIDADGVERGRFLGYAEWDKDSAAEFIRGCVGP